MEDLEELKDLVAVRIRLVFNKSSLEIVEWFVFNLIYQNFGFKGLRGGGLEGLGSGGFGGFRRKRRR